MKTIGIFISSPGDVAEERDLCKTAVPLMGRSRSAGPAVPREP